MSLISVFDKYQWVKGAWATNAWHPKTLFSDGGTESDYRKCTGVCAEGAIHVDMGRSEEWSTARGVNYNFQGGSRYFSPTLSSGGLRTEIDILSFRDSLHRVGDYIASKYLRHWLSIKDNTDLIRHKGKRCPCWKYQDGMMISDSYNTVTEIEKVKYCFDWRTALDEYEHNTIPAFNDQRGLTEEVIKKFLGDLDQQPQYQAVRQLLRLSPLQFGKVQRGFKSAYMVQRSQVKDPELSSTYAEILAPESTAELELFYNALIESRCI